MTRKLTNVAKRNAIALFELRREGHRGFDQELSAGFGEFHDESKRRLVARPDNSIGELSSDLPPCLEISSAEDLANRPVMQFGRTGPDTFSLDVAYPLSVAEAFSLALSTFDAYDAS